MSEEEGWWRGLEIRRLIAFTLPNRYGGGLDSLKDVDCPRAFGARCVGSKVMQSTLQSFDQFLECLDPCDLLFPTRDAEFPFVPGDEFQELSPAAGTAPFEGDRVSSCIAVDEKIPGMRNIGIRREIYCERGAPARSDRADRRLGGGENSVVERADEKIGQIASTEIADRDFDLISGVG